jgi:long-chain fatty acid transport protein
VFKIGVAWELNSTLMLRAGYNHSQNPIRASDVTFNILAPGVMTSHYTLGFIRALSKDSELTGALMVAPRQGVAGPSLFNAVLGPGAGGNETIRMRELSVGLGWSKRF